MIATDQPICFPDNVLVRVSSRGDGTLLDRINGERHAPEVVARRRAFCAKAGVDYDTCAYMIITYDTGRTYDVIREVTEPNTEGYLADVLYTTTPGIGLFLPVADCIGTVIYDPVQLSLTLAHVGRHASEADTLAKTISYLAEKGSNPEDLIIWMAPAVTQDHYRMDYFAQKEDLLWRGFFTEKDDGVYIDLQGYNRSRAIASGVLPAHIYTSEVDTAVDPHYFSHSQGDTSGRFAVVAMLRP